VCYGRLDTRPEYTLGTPTDTTNAYRNPIEADYSGGREALEIGIIGVVGISLQGQTRSTRLEEYTSIDREALSFQRWSADLRSGHPEMLRQSRYYSREIQ